MGDHWGLLLLLARVLILFLLRGEQTFSNPSPQLVFVWCQCSSLVSKQHSIHHLGPQTSHRSPLLVFTQSLDVRDLFICQRTKFQSGFLSRYMFFFVAHLRSFWRDLASFSSFVVSKLMPGQQWHNVLLPCLHLFGSGSFHLLFLFSICELFFARVSSSSPVSRGERTKAPTLPKTSHCAPTTRRSRSSPTPTSPSLKQQPGVG